MLITKYSTILVSCNLAFASQFVLAQSVENADTMGEVVDLDSITIVTEQMYDAIVTENTRDYSSYAATVGSKLPAVVRQIPQSISIITSAQIKDRNVKTFDQLAERTPGLRVLRNDDGRSSVYARGYEYDEYNIDGLTAPMQSINGTLPNLIAFDRVEILRGPSGLFDSSGEMGGVVNFVRKRPTKELQGIFNLGVGNRKNFTVDGDISGSLNESGSVRGRILAQTSGESPRPAKNNNHHQSFYSALDWDISPSTTLGLGYLYQRRKITPVNGLAAYQDGSLLPLPNHTFMGNSWNDFNMYSHDVFADLKHHFADGSFAKLAMRYSDRHADSNYTFAGSALNPQGVVNVTGLGTLIKQDSFAMDASYSRPFEIGSTLNEWVVGADYNQSNFEYDQARVRSLGTVHYQDFDSISHVDIMDAALQNKRGFSLSQTGSNLKEMGIYSKLVMRPVDALTLIVGARLGHYQLKAGEVFDKERKSGTKITAYGGLVVDLDDQNSLYASYSSLYRPQTELGVDNKLLKPRYGSQVEMGYKGAFVNDALNVRLSLYRLHDKNAAASIPGNNAQYAALGKRVMQGVEFELSGQLTDQWRMHAGYSYLSSDIKVDSTTRDDGVFLLMPRHSFNLWSTYDITPAFTLGAGVNVMSSIESSQGVKGRGYATIDAMLSYQATERVKLQLNVDNLANRKYYTRVGSLNTFNIPGKERTIKANINYRF